MQIWVTDRPGGIFIFFHCLKNGFGWVCCGNMKMIRKRQNDLVVPKYKNVECISVHWCITIVYICGIIIYNMLSTCTSKMKLGPYIYHRSVCRFVQEWVIETLEFRYPTIDFHTLDKSSPTKLQFSVFGIVVCITVSDWTANACRYMPSFKAKKPSRTLWSQCFFSQMQTTNLCESFLM